MSMTIKARFSGGVLKPLEKLELAEGEEVLVTVAASGGSKGGDFLRRTEGGWLDLVDGDQLKKDIEDSRLAGGRAIPRL